MVSTTSPIAGSFLRMVRTMSRPFPSGSWRSVTTTTGLLSRITDSACATPPAWPTTVIPGSRSKARARPVRISSWSSTRTTGTGGRVGVSAMGSSCLVPRHLPSISGGIERNNEFDPGMVRGVVQVQLRPDPSGSLLHDAQAVGVVPAHLQSSPVVLDPDLRMRWVDRAGDHDLRGASMLDRIVHRPLGDPEQLLLHPATEAGLALIELDHDRDAGPALDVAGECLDGLSERGAGVCVVAQTEDGERKSTRLNSSH